MSNQPLLSVQNLQVDYRTGKEAHTAIENVSFDVFPGEVLALVGESGSGKTTTAQAIIGLLADNGEIAAGGITFAGQQLTALNENGWREVRGARIALIPQDPTVSLDPVRRVGAQVEDVLRLHTELSADERRERVYELFELVGFRDVEKRYRQYPHELSGGMRQRVLIAAAVASDPDLIIADEPTSGLDATVQKQVLDLIDRLRIEMGTAIILVTHDLGVAADRSDSIGVMSSGRLVELGRTAEVLDNPQHEYTRQLLGSILKSPAARTWYRDRVVPTRENETPTVMVRNLRKEYGDLVAIDDTSFQVNRGETFSIVGESGSGKSTTARILTGLTQATSGTVEVLGHDITGLNQRQFRRLRGDIQIVYQNPYATFDPRFNVFDVIEEPLRAFSPGRISNSLRKEHEEKVAAALEAAVLSPDFAKRHPRELSGGQRQRVAIARALILNPKLVVLDEPISALDASVAAQIIDLLQDLQEQLGLTYVFISHDLAVVSAISDRIAVMRDGLIVEQGTVQEVFDNPRTDYTVSLLDAIAGRNLRKERALV